MSFELGEAYLLFFRFRKAFTSVVHHIKQELKEKEIVLLHASFIR